MGQTVVTPEETPKPLTKFEVLSVHLKDYERVRTEIDNRQAQQAQLLTYYFATVGAVVGFTTFGPATKLVIVSLVSSVFENLVLDHTIMIFRLAAYAALRLAPNVAASVPSALQWENFLRKLRDGGTGAAVELFGSEERAPSDFNLPRFNQTGGTFSTLLWGVATVTLVAACLAHIDLVWDPLVHRSAGHWGRLWQTMHQQASKLTLLTVCILVRCWTVHNARQGKRCIDALDKAIIHGHATSQTRPAPA